MGRPRTIASTALSLGLAVAAAGCTDDDDDAGAGFFEMPDSTGENGSAGTTTGTASSSGDDLDDGLDDGPVSTTMPTPPPDPSSSGEPPDATGSSTGEASTGGSDGFDTSNDGVLEVEVNNQSMFPDGQCDDVIVTNVSAMAVVWEVELPLPGTIDQLWNAEVVEAEGSGVFTGLRFNAELAPSQQAMFGYCVMY